MKYEPKVIKRVTRVTENGKVVSKREERIVHRRCQECGRTEDELRHERTELGQYNHLSHCDICGEQVCLKDLNQVKGIHHSCSEELLFGNTEFPFALCRTCTKTYKTELEEIQTLLRANKEMYEVLKTGLKKISTVLASKRKTGVR